MHLITEAPWPPACDCPGRLKAVPVDVAWACECRHKAISYHVCHTCGARWTTSVTVAQGCESKVSLAQALAASPFARLYGTLNGVPEEML